MDAEASHSDLTARVEAGDRAALGPLLESYRGRLRRMIEHRLDRRLRGRLDVSDVIQDAYLDVAARYEEYRENPKLAPYLWVRFLTVQKLAEVHRVHLGAQARDARREVGMPRPQPAETSFFVAEFTDSGTLPDGKVMRGELQQKVASALEGMPALDREVLVLRHFEQMSNADVAAELEITREAASKRYLRALKRIKSALGG